MIALLALLALQTPVSVETPAASGEVVVIGERIRRIRLHTKTDRETGLRRCNIKRSTGLPWLDAAVCDATLECAKVAKISAQMQACLAPRMEEIAHQRTQRRSQ